MSAPLVSIILPAFNCQLFIKDCIDSLLRQSYTNFELLVYNDCSTDNTKEELAKLSDVRIRVIHKTENSGYVKLLNEGIITAKGKYILRMDADDICNENRIEVQVDYMEKNLDVGVCGSYVEVFGNIKSYIWQLPTNDNALKACLPFRTPFVHPSVIIRKSVLIDNKITYKNEFLPAEDYEIWNNLASKTKFANIPIPLLKYRQHEHQISKEKRTIQQNNSNNVREIYYKNLFVTKDDYTLYQNIVNEQYDLSIDFLMSAIDLFDRLENENRKMELLDEVALRQELSYQVFKIATHLSSKKIKTYKAFSNSNYRSSTHVNKQLYLKYILKNIF